MEVYYWGFFPWDKKLGLFEFFVSVMCGCHLVDVGDENPKKIPHCELLCFLNGIVMDSDGDRHGGYFCSNIQPLDR